MLWRNIGIQYLISNELGRSDEWWFSVLFTVPFGLVYSTFRPAMLL